MPTTHETETTAFGTASLGSLIAALERCGGDLRVRFRFGSLSPSGLDSYRGYYDHLALGYDDDAWPTVSLLLGTLRAAVGSTFHGWKGGQYRMSTDTPVWVANAGRCGDTVIVGVTVEGSYEPSGVVIETREESDG